MPDKSITLEDTFSLEAELSRVMEAGETPVENPQTLDELFTHDPLEWSDEHLAKIVSKLRQLRLTWDKEEVEAKQNGRRPKKEVLKPQVKTEISDDLDDLLGSLS